MNSTKKRNPSPNVDPASPHVNPQPVRLLPTLPRSDELSREIIPGDLAVRQSTLRLMRGEHLSRNEAGEFLHALLNPDATDAQIAASLTALAMKGETAEELAGMAEGMRDRAV